MKTVSKGNSWPTRPGPSGGGPGRVGQRPREGDQRHRRDARRRERDRHLARGRSGGQDIVDEDHVRTCERSSAGGEEAEGSAHVLAPLEGTQGGLGRGPLESPERSPAGQARTPRQPLGEEIGLVVAAGPEATGCGGHRDDDPTSVGRRATGRPPQQPRHPSRHEAGELPPTLVLERVDEVRGRRLQRVRVARGPELVRPPLAVQTPLGLRTTGAARMVTAAAARPGSGPQARSTRRADELGSSPDPPAAGDAARGKQEVEQLRGPRRRQAEAARTLSMARRITSKGAGTPHHRSKAAAPCCTSISAPSVTRMPWRSAAFTNGVASGP